MTDLADALPCTLPVVCARVRRDGKKAHCAMCHASARPAVEKLREADKARIAEVSQERDKALDLAGQLVQDQYRLEREKLAAETQLNAAHEEIGNLQLALQGVEALIEHIETYFPGIVENSRAVLKDKTNG